MFDSADVQVVKNLIRTHLKEVGPKEWKHVRLQCPDISDATFWRYIKAVREEAEVGAGAGVPGVQSTRSATDDEVPNLGALPKFYNPLEKARLYESLLADAEIMRAQAIDHRGRITNWRMFEKSIQLRERLVCQQREAASYFQSQEVMAKFFEQILGIVDELPEGVRNAFMDRLGELQQQRLARAP